MPGERKNKKQKQRLFKQNSAMIHTGRARETVDTERAHGTQQCRAQPSLTSRLLQLPLCRRLRDPQGRSHDRDLSELCTKDPKMFVFMVDTCEEYVKKNGLCKREAHSDHMTPDPPMHSPSPHFFFLSPKRQSHKH